MKQNESLNNTCILFDKDNEAQQKAIIRFYNDNGWVGECKKRDCEDCIGIFKECLDYWYYSNNPKNIFKVIDLPKEYYPIDKKITLKIGDKLIAKTDCRMNDGDGYALIIGKEYDVINTSPNLSEISVKSELFEQHNFSTNLEDDSYWGNFFNPISAAIDNIVEDVKSEQTEIEKILLDYSYWLNENHITHIVDYVDIEEVKRFLTRQ